MEAGVRGVNYSPTRVVVVLALLLALGSFGVVEIVNPGKLLDWFIQLSATFLAIVGGIWLFHYQAQTTEEQLREKLRTRVALEWKRNLERLETGVTTPFVRQRPGERAREHLGEIVTAELSTVALRDLIRSEAFEPEEVLSAMRLEARINAYKDNVETLLERFEPAVSAQMLRSTLVEMNERKNLLIHDLGEQLRSLREQGIEVPD